MGGFAGDHRIEIHFRAGGRQRNYRAQRNGLRDCGALGAEVPGVALRVKRGQRDELGGIEHRAAADREQESDFFPAAYFDGLHAGLIVRIGFNAPKLQHLKARESLLDLVIDAIGANGTAATGH